MNSKKYLKFIFIFLIFSACDVKWDLNIFFNEDLSGTYNISILIDQEAQLYALETSQSSIGGLEAIVSNLPDGFGSSIYQEDDYLGILVRNEFKNTDEMLKQFELLKSDENTALLLMPIKELIFTEKSGKFFITGEFAKLFVTNEENIEGYKKIFDGELKIKVPGQITSPVLPEIVDNTIVFKSIGIIDSTFELTTILSKNYQYLMLSLIALLGLIIYLTRQYLKKN